MSGGVDSVGRRRAHGRRRPRRRRGAPGAVAAPGTLRTGSRGCCSKEDAGDARRVADVLGIPFYVWDFADRFKEDVIDDFVAAYAPGETPNPCVRCNEKIKFSALAARALALGFDAVATGHYARLSRRRLRRAVDRDKDQSYVLAVLTAEQLRHAMFPIGDTPKPRIRAEAAARGLAVADKPDSHDICFIPSGDTRAFLGAPARRAPRRRSSTRRGDGARRTRRRARLHRRPAQGAGHRRPRPGRPAALRAGHRAGDRHRARRRRAERWTCGAIEASGRCSPRGVAPAGPVECVVQVRAHGGLAPAIAELAAPDLRRRAGGAAARGGARPDAGAVPARPRRRRGARQRRRSPPPASASRQSRRVRRHDPAAMIPRYGCPGS